MPRRILLLAFLIISIKLPAATAAPSTGERCFPGIPGISDCLDGRFEEYWDESGGLPVFGYPLTPAFVAATRDGNAMSQMLERNRLEYHPELAPPYDVLLGRLGDDLLAARGRDWRAEPAGQPLVGCWFAEETRHTVCDQEVGRGFLTYYRSHGLDLGDAGISEREALALWGLPLTEPALETNAAGDTVLTQWFERARFEYHPDKPAQYRVLLGLLGSEAWGNQARPPASADPVPPRIGDPAPPPPAPSESPTDQPSPTPTSEPAPVPTQQPEATPTSARPTATPTVEPIAPEPTATTPSSLRPADEALKQRLLDLVDPLHQQAGCAPFLRDSRLDRAAQSHAEDIAAHRRIDHVGTDGATLRQRLDRAGYPYQRASESIGVYRTPEEAVRFWMDEPPNGPHRLNITNCQYTDVGIGFAYDSRGIPWWVMDVANRRPGH